MPSQAEIQKEITRRIIDGLVFGTVPWKKPWSNDPNSGAPANVISRRNYSGINPILLDLVAMSRGYTSRWWGTYQQWASLGVNVRKRPRDIEPGQWGTPIVFWKQVQKTRAGDDGDKTETFPLLRYYTVFNAEQVEGEAAEGFRVSDDASSLPDQADYEPARRAIAATGADFRFGGDRACYIRPIGPFPNHDGGDYICLPKPGQFTKPQDFFAVSLHELVHWSEARLGWTGSYAMGELIAEIGACFLCAQVGIPCSDDLGNHTAYVDNWLQELQEDERAIMRAASQASKAAEFILSFSRKAEPKPEEVEAA